MDKILENLSNKILNRIHIEEQEYEIVAIIIFVLAPVGNTTKPLEEQEIKIYGKKSRRIVVILSSIMLIGMILRNEVIYSSIVYSFMLAAAAVLAGKIKYRNPEEKKKYI